MYRYPYSQFIKAVTAETTVGSMNLSNESASLFSYVTASTIALIYNDQIEFCIETNC